MAKNTHGNKPPLIPAGGGAARGAAGNRLRAFARAFLQERRCTACKAVFQAPLHGATALPARSFAAGAAFLRSLSFPASVTAFFCPDCLSRLKRREGGFCPLCGELAASPDLPPAPCGACLQKPPVWEKAVFHGEYTGLLRDLLVGVKFHDQSVNARALGLLLFAHPELRARTFDIVLPVPLHNKRLSERGYNQALEIARPLAACLKSRLMPGALERRRVTAPQTGLSRPERARNTQGAFIAPAPLDGLRVLLVDDVMTTGATMQAAASALAAAGAATITVAAAARVAAEAHSLFH